MITLSTQHINSPLCVEDIRTRLKKRITNNMGEALSTSNDYLFTGILADDSFTLSLIQRGRIVPMPRIYGMLDSSSQETKITIIGKPGLSSTLHIITWSAFGLGMSIYGFPTLGLFALGFPILCLSYVWIMIWFLRREFQQAVHQIEMILEQ